MRKTKQTRSNSDKYEIHDDLLDEPHLMAKTKLTKWMEAYVEILNNSIIDI
jgi:hypothetical protein